MALIIPISFKESELELYSFLKSQISPSIYIKEILYKAINNIDIQNSTNNKPKDTANNIQNNDELYNIYCFKKETDEDGLKFEFYNE